MNDSLSHQLLRRTLVGGYRVADVEVLLAQFRLLVTQLDTELKSARSRLEASEADRRELARRLDEALHREVEVAASAARLRQAQAEAERQGAERGRELVEAAQAEADRIRADASNDVAAARAQVDELLRLRDTLSATMRGIVRDFESVAGTVDATRIAVPAPPAPPTPAPTETPTLVAAPSPPVTSAPAVERDVFDRQIEVEAGPFTDFASLSAFERALGGLPKVEDVYIRRFEGERATIDVTLEEPAAILDAMTERLPYRLDVQSAHADRISLTVSAA